jgi:hypothetical protein
VDQKTRELIAQAELLWEQFQQTVSLYEDFLARTRTVGTEIERRVTRVLSEAEKNRHNPDKARPKEGGDRR